MRLCWWILLMLPLVFDYSWERLHACGARTLAPTVQDYAERFPCEECRDHFSALVADHPFPLEHVATDEEARVWTWLTHNIVNRRLGKPWFPYAAVPR